MSKYEFVCRVYVPGFMISYFTGRRDCVAFVVNATGESSESSTSLTIVKSVQNVVSPPSHLILYFLF